MKVDKRIALGGVVVAAACAALVAVFAPAGEAAEPVTVPTAAGQTVTVSWQGTILPGANTSSECSAGSLGADTHDVEILVPAGTYDQVTVQATATIAYSGPNDVIVTVDLPDGSKLSGDQGFVDTDESVAFANPDPGVYRIIACMFVGAVPQPYTGTLTFEATTEPLEAARSCGAPGKPLRFTAPSYVDTQRAGGEPSVVAHPDGTLLYAAHAGTTHFFAPGAPEGSEAFYEKYRGQVHAWTSDDHGLTWSFVDRTIPPEGIPGSGFSDPDFAIDPAGNVYIAWDEGGSGAREAGVWYSYSTDAGHTWAAPVRVDTDDRTDIWPWIAAGDPGRGAVAWFGNDSALPSNDAEQAGPNDGWNVYVAQTTTGLGCNKSPNPGFRVTQATPQPFHVGTVCMGGTICQAQLVDRRLGDYFTIDVDTTGALVAAYSDTRQGGAVALPAFFRQTGGPIFFSSGHGRSP